MLILAGVSLNAVVGDNGIITMAQLSNIESRFAKYKEEMEMNLVSKIGDETIESESQVTVLNDSVKRYIPSLEDDDIGQFGIIAGKLYYIGDNELSMKAAKSQNIEIMPSDTKLEDFINEVESLAIENFVLTYGGEAFKNQDNNPLGVPLYNKNLENADKWRIITEVENNSVKATYGTGWYFVESGTEVDGLGTLNKNYIIDYNNRLAVRFDASKHTLMSYESALAVSDHLIFNADPGVMEEYNSLSTAEKANFDISKLGAGIEFHGYYTDANNNGIQDANEPTDLSQAFSTTSFKFDGVDDYMTLPYNSSTDFSKGFTYEFYGKINGIGKHFYYNWSTEEFVEYEEPNEFIGLMGLWPGNETSQARLRFGLYPNGTLLNLVSYNWGYTKVNDTWSSAGNEWNHRVAISDQNIEYSDIFHFTIVVDVENLTQKIYINGNLFGEGTIEKKGWDSFLRDEIPQVKKILFGRCSMNADGYWHYMNSEIYSLRLYTRGLTSSEVLANYNATVSYHQFLENNGNAGTGGDTGGTGY